MAFSLSPSLLRAAKAQASRSAVMARIIEEVPGITIHYEHSCSVRDCHVGAIPGTSAERKTSICAYCDHAHWSGRGGAT